MFGDGVLGAQAILLCCGFTVIAPALYVFVFMVGALIPNFRPLGWSILTVILSYVWVGYLFGDVLGLLAAFLVFLTCASVLWAGPKRVVYYANKRKIMPQRFTFFDEDENLIIDP